MEAQLPRRRASGTLRDQEFTRHSKPVEKKLTSSHPNKEIDHGERRLRKDGSTLNKTEETNHQVPSPVYVNSHRSRRYLSLTAAMTLLVMSVTMFFINQDQFAFSPVHEGPWTPGDDMGIPLQPGNHIYRPATTIEYHWIVSTDFRAPDGVKKRVYLVNGVFPGPTVEVRSGDTLKIQVENHIDDNEGLSIHWHGLNMRGSNAMDGAVGFTQCSIPKGYNFTYEFHIDEDQSGTFWYHAHSQVQRADGLYGGLIVHRPAAQGLKPESRVHNYEKEVLLLIGDWYHRSGEEILRWYLSIGSYGNEPVPDSLLINGAGRFNCSMAAPARPLQCMQKPIPRLRVDDPRPVRFRIVNVGSLAGFSIQTSNAKMLAIHVDGGNEIEASDADMLGIIYPGERVDIIIRWNIGAELVGSSLQVSFDEEDFTYPNPSLVSEQSFPVDLEFKSHPHSVRPRLEEQPLSHFDLQTAHSRRPQPLLPEQPQQIMVYTTIMKLSKFNNIPKGFMNHTSWQPQSSPSLPLLYLSKTLWDENQLIPWIKHSDDEGGESGWVDIVLNNLNEGGHPFHLHGHNFYVLSTYKSSRGWGSFNPFTTAPEFSPAGAYNLDKPLKKDTVFVPRRGYVVLRFRADNEGIWMFHCHILWHQASGMAMGFQVGGSESDGLASPRLD